jgi:putative addiction module component (TIGR02574 family)
MNNSKTIIDKALKLKPAEKFIVIEALIKSLDTPDPNIEIAWADEAESRLKAYKEGKLEVISFEDMFK